MTMENLEVDRSLYDIGDSDLKELWAPETFESPMVDMSSESDWSTILDNPIILHDRMMSDAVQSPRIQSEHSYSMTSSDEGPDSPLSITPHIKIEDMESECFPAVPVSTATGQSDLAPGVVVVKQEPLSPPPPPPASPPPPPPLTPAPSRTRTTASSSSRLLSTALASAPLIATPLPALACVSATPAVSAGSHHHQQQSLLKQPTIVLAAPRHERHLNYPKVNVKLEPPSGFVLPPTPPSSHSSDSDGSLSPVHSTENRSPTSFTVAAGPDTQPGASSPGQGSSSSSSSSSHHPHHASTSSSSSMSRRSQSHSRVAVAPSSSSSSSSSRSSGSGASGGGGGSQLISNQAKGATGVLILTDEEKRTLLAEGYPIPQRLPLTKAEERSLKKIRRKIKNKISAQESRRKKKEYMDSLEKKVETLISENQEYKKKVDALESNNRSLLSQLQRLQVLIGDHAVRSGSHSSVSRSTTVQMDFEADDEPVDII